MASSFCDLAAGGGSIIKNKPKNRINLDSGGHRKKNWREKGHSGHESQKATSETPKGSKGGVKFPAGYREAW